MRRGFSLAEARVSNVNVGNVKRLAWLGHEVDTAIWKHRVSHAVHASRSGMVGDRQADLTAHGGSDKAVYAYAQEDIDWWVQQLDADLGVAPFGENLTTIGVDLSSAVIGDRWLVGATTVLEVSQPRIPCFKLGLRHSDPRLPARVAAALRPGAYLRVLREGPVAEFDAIRIVRRPGHGVSIATVAGNYHVDRTEAERLLGVPELAPGWHAWARRIKEHRPST